MGSVVGLITAVLLGILAAQAEPITATLGYIWAVIHMFATVRYWNDNLSND